MSSEFVQNGDLINDSFFLFSVHNLSKCVVCARENKLRWLKKTANRTKKHMFLIFVIYKFFQTDLIHSLAHGYRPCTILNLEKAFFPRPSSSRFQAKTDQSSCYWKSWRVIHVQNVECFFCVARTTIEAPCLSHFVQCVFFSIKTFQLLLLFAVNRHILTQPSKNHWTS